MNPLLEARGVGVDRGGRAVLRDVDLRLSPGTVTCLLGPNGSGKSSLLGVLSGVLRPSFGEVRVEGEATDRWSPRAWARKVALCPQQTLFDAPFTVREAVEMGRYALKGGWGGYDGEDREAARRALVSLGLEGFEERSVMALSGGEAARVALARTLARETGVLLLDEPTAALDPRQTLQVLARIRGLAEEGAAVLAVFHDVNLALRGGDRLVFLRQGRILGETGSARPDLELLGATYGLSWELLSAPGGRVLVPRL